MSGIWMRRPEGTVETASLLRKWWLSNIKGGKVLEEKLRPRKNAFGDIFYERAWVIQTEQEGK